MTVDEILEQVKALTAQQRDELVQRLMNMPGAPEQTNKPKTGAEIVALLEAMDEPIELVDSHIEDPVEWVKTQRRKRQEQLKPYWGEED